MRDGYTKIITAVIGLIITIITFAGSLSNLMGQSQQLRIASLLGYIVFVGGVVWFAFKSDGVSRSLRLAGLVILYIVTIPYFIWVGTWFAASSPLVQEPSPTAVVLVSSTETPMPPAPVAAQTLAQPTVMPTNTSPATSQLPQSSETPTLSPVSLSPDCKVGVLCDVIPKYAVGGKVFSWSSPTDSVTSDLIQTCAWSGALGLEINYALSGENDNGGWGVHWVNSPDKRLDVSHLGYLTFWVKGTIGNETFQIGLKDIKGTEFKIQSNEFTSSIAEWTLITIPLSWFKDVSTDSVENVSFSFTRQHRAGSICVDDIGFQ